MIALLWAVVITSGIGLAYLLGVAVGHDQEHHYCRHQDIPGFQGDPMPEPWYRELRGALRLAVAISRQHVHRSPHHGNPYHYADDAVRDALEDLLADLALEEESRG